MHESITWVGIDAHKRSLQLAVLEGGQLREWENANESEAIQRVARKLIKQASGEVRCCYEAGPIGYATHGCGAVRAPVTPPPEASMVLNRAQRLSGA